MAAMLTIFFTLCVSVLLLTAIIYCPLSAFEGGVAIGILSLFFAAVSFSTPSTTTFDSG